MSTKLHPRPVVSRNFLPGRVSASIWRLFPTWLRTSTYRLLRGIGSYLYEPDAMGVLQRTLFGCYIKCGPAKYGERHRWEFDALHLVRSHTSIPVPRPIDLAISGSESFLVTSRVDGERAGKFIFHYTDEERDALLTDLRQWITELHAILKPPSEYAITSASGGSCLDYRIDTSGPVRPYRSEKDFSESLCIGALPDLTHRHDHKNVFTHGDLNMRNILVKHGRIVGIVDWENAGWFPEYWEYTKAHFSVRRNKRWLEIIDAAFVGKYEAELDIEKQYFEYHSL